MPHFLADTIRLRIAAFVTERWMRKESGKVVGCALCGTSAVLGQDTFSVHHADGCPAGAVSKLTTQLTLADSEGRDNDARSIAHKLMQVIKKEQIGSACKECSCSRGHRRFCLTGLVLRTLSFAYGVPAGTNASDSPEIPPTESSAFGDSAYNRFFVSAVKTGWLCGLLHPVEIAINAHRTPGGTLSEEYYRTVEKHLPRFLCEVYEDVLTRTPESAEDVLEFCDSHYHQGHLCRGYFDFLRDDIQKYVQAHYRDG